MQVGSVLNITVQAVKRPSVLASSFLNMYVPNMTTARIEIHQAALRLFAERGVTQVTVSDLAEAAGVARGTVYNNMETVESLFEDVATRLTTEMEGRIAVSSAGTEDPAQRVADGIRFFVRRAHEDPSWGRFLIRFGASTPTLRGLLGGAPTVDLRLGSDTGRFQIRPDQLASAVAVMSGGVLPPSGSCLKATGPGATRVPTQPSWCCAGSGSRLTRPRRWLRASCRHCRKEDSDERQRGRHSAPDRCPPPRDSAGVRRVAGAPRRD